LDESTPITIEWRAASRPESWGEVAVRLVNDVVIFFTEVLSWFIPA
jgi:hypothetical protein